ncbi:hypothetical protein LEP1GSC192_1445 [Leptospira sp. B5-022]|nr:hypothetical protein LEP1GSC192_1445 [Leptospira sp. B5-022]
MEKEPEKNWGKKKTRPDVFPVPFRYSPQSGLYKPELATAIRSLDDDSRICGFGVLQKRSSRCGSITAPAAGKS